MKIEVGMYVRTNEGIGTVQRIYNNKNDCTVKFKKGHVKKWVTIFKTSNNIIDLIEVGDYVNGVLVESIYSREEDKMCFHTFGTEIMIEVTKENINNIVTKEQFESMSYKVGE